MYYINTFSLAAGYIVVVITMITPKDMNNRTSPGSPALCDLRISS